jgi:cytochrome c biogenesis protein CcmG, thiol:disulfide interchange protein DsbE
MDATENASETQAPRAGSKRLLAPLAAIVGGAAVVGLLVYGVWSQSPTRTLDEDVAHHLHPRAPSAGMALPLLSGGGRASLSSYRGRVVVLNFWASWCEPCQREAPMLDRAQIELAHHGGTVLGVTYLDASPDSLSFVARFHVSYPNLRDTTGDFARAYGTNQLPETFVIDRAGHIVAISRGEVNEAFLRRGISLAERL